MPLRSWNDTEASGTAKLKTTSSFATAVSRTTVDARRECARLATQRSWAFIQLDWETGKDPKNLRQVPWATLIQYMRNFQIA